MTIFYIINVAMIVLGVVVVYGSLYIFINGSRQQYEEYLKKNKKETENLNNSFSMEDMKKSFEAGCEGYYDDNDGRTTMSKSLVKEEFDRFIDLLNKNSK